MPLVYLLLKKKKEKKVISQNKLIMEIFQSIEDTSFGDQQELTANITSQLSWPAFLHFSAGF